MDRSQEALTAIIAEHMKTLPPEVKDVVTGFDWLQTLQDIAARYKLNIEQQGVLGTEVTMSILGITHPDDFSHELRNSLNIGKEETENMIVDINEKIFRPIRAKLIGVYNKNQEEKARLITGEMEEEIEEENEHSSQKISLAQELTSAMEKKEEKPIPQINSTKQFSENIEKAAQQPEDQKPIEPKIINPTPAPATFVENNTPKEKEIFTPAKEDNMSSNILNNKLGNMFGVEKKDSDHTIKREGSSAEKTQNSTDPYRETV